MRTSSSHGLLSWPAVQLLSLLLLGVTTARAEPVRVTDGTLVGDSFGVTLSATGERGLSILASGDKTGGHYGPALCTPCLPGDRVNLLSMWSGSDFPGVVSIDGGTFGVDIGTGSTGSLLAAFEGGIVMMPEFSGERLATLSAPFSFHGFLNYPVQEGVDRPREALVGGGTMMAQYEWESAFDYWNFTGARYEFSPVPEPASLTLLGLGLAGIGAQGWRRLKKVQLGPPE